MVKGMPVKVSEIDDHDMHINEHIAYMLGNEFENASKIDEKLEEKFLKHIREHKKIKSLIEQSQKE